MKLVALYKTFDGGVLLDASLASIYPHVDSIVMVHSDVSWLGEHGNTVREPALAWCQEHDQQAKVHHLDVSLDSQEAQYAAGIAYIQQHHLGDVVMTVDADEVWEANSIEAARQQIHDNPADSYRCAMHTYLKTPFYRVTPVFGTPTVFFRNPRLLLESPRGCRSRGRPLSHVWMHHYTYVRESREDVARKLRQSAHGDGGEAIREHWMEEVYDRLPEGRNLHAFTRWQHVWQAIETIWMSDLPPAVRSARSLSLWVPQGMGETLIEGEANALHRLASGREQAVDLGTYHGLSAVFLSLACRRVHTVDCYEDLPEGAFADTLMPHRYEHMSGHSLAATRRLAARFGNITCEKSETSAAARHWPGGPVDVLFVDSDHSEDGTRRNVESWLIHMHPGARIIFHDDNDIHPGVQSVVRAMRVDSRFRFIDPGEDAGSLAVCEVL